MKIRNTLPVLFFLFAAARFTAGEGDGYAEQGARLLREGDLPGAIEMLDRALETDPGDAGTRELLHEALKGYEGVLDDLTMAYLLLERGDTDGAKELFESVLATGMDGRLTGLAERGLGKSRDLGKMKEEAAALYEAGDHAGARAAWKKVREVLPGDADAPLFLSKITYAEEEGHKIREQAGIYFENGVRLLAENKLEEAAEQFENALALGYRPEQSRDYVEKIRRALADREREADRKEEEDVALSLREGIKLFNTSRYREALAALNRAYRADPENTQVREYIVRVKIAQRRETETTVEPSSPFYDLYTNLTRLGTEAYARKDYTEAIRYWEEILLIFPFNEIARMNLTKALTHTDPRLAEEILEDMYGEASALVDAGRKREAVARLELIIQADPGFERARTTLRELVKEVASGGTVVTDEDRALAGEYYVKGLNAYREENLDDAVAMWRKAVELDPDFEEARVYLSQAETKARNLKRQKSAVIPETEAQITIKRHYLFGVTFFMDGLYREAISEWKQVLALNPDHKMAKANIVRAKSRLALQGEGS